MIFSVNASAVATGTSVKTILQLIAGTNHQIKIRELALTFAGVDNTATPILVELLRQTTAGTMTSANLRKMNDSDGNTIDASGQHTATAEPTAGDILRSWYVHPQSGFHYVVPEPALFKVGAGDRIGLRVTAAATVSCAGYIEAEE